MLGHMETREDLIQRVRRERQLILGFFAQAVPFAI